MPGGLVQLTGFGAQNVFLNGNPSMTYFTKMYKRHTNFAMEHFQLPPMNATDTNLPIAGNKTFRFKVPRRPSPRLLSLCRYPRYMVSAC